MNEKELKLFIILCLTIFLPVSTAMIGSYCLQRHYDFKAMSIGCSQVVEGNGLMWKCPSQEK